MSFLLIAVRSEELCSALEDELYREYHIISCYDGVRALDLLNSTRPDALIMDLMLPKMDGLTVLEQAETVPQVVLCTTSYLSESVIKTAQVLGVGSMILKPCSAGYIIKTFNELVRRRSHKA